MKKTFLLLVAFVLFGVTVFGGTLRITVPNGATTWILGSPQTISWTATGDFANPVKLTLFKDGARVGPIVGNLDATDQSYRWARAGEYREGSLTGPVRTALTGEGYTIKIIEQRGGATNESEEFSLTSSVVLVIRPDLTVTNVFKDSMGNLGIRIKCANVYRGNCMVRVENPNLPRGGFKQRMHSIDLRNFQERNFLIGALTPEEWAAVFSAESSVCGSAYFTGIVDPNDQVDENNEDNNSLRTRVFFHPGTEGQIVPPIGVGKFDREVNCNQAIAVRPVDVHSQDGDFVELQIKVNVRNCGGMAIRNGTLKFEQFYTTAFGDRETRILDYADIVHELTTVNVEPGRYETYRPRMRVRFKYSGRSMSNNKLRITLLPAERGTSAGNNICDDISLVFSGF